MPKITTASLLSRRLQPDQSPEKQLDKRVDNFIRRQTFDSRLFPARLYLVTIGLINQPMLRTVCRNFTGGLSSRNPFASRLLVSMQTFETIDSKVARRCRYHQHRGKTTTVTVEGSPVTGLVRSVMEVQASNPRRWLITVIAKPSIAA
jgi:hypothetical protein